MTDRHAIHLECEPDANGWRCTVVVGDDPGATTHRVGVTAADLERLAPPGVAVERLVDASFGFLLEREPRESILREFDLLLIGRYFPEYEGELRRHLAGNDAGA
jgi:hypothetical protein